MRTCKICRKPVNGYYKRCIDCHNIMKDRFEALKHEYLVKEFALAR